jgi:TM2 domain-containing membrane protein YozV
MLVEQHVTNERKSMGAAYLMWFFVGFFAAHRFSLGRPGSALLLFTAHCVAFGVLFAFLANRTIPSTALIWSRCRWSGRG